MTLYSADLWTFIRQSLALPWFHLSLERTEREYEEPYKLVDTVFATRREQWLNLERVDPDTRVLGIQLVSPPWLNKTATWRMGLFARFGCEFSRKTVQVFGVLIT